MTIQVDFFAHATKSKNYRELVSDRKKFIKKKGAAASDIEEAYSIAYGKYYYYYWSVA